MLPVQSTASPPLTVLQKSRSFIEPHPPARGTSDPNSRSLASPCGSLFEMLKVWACCCLWVRPRLVCGSPSTAQCGFHRHPSPGIVKGWASGLGKRARWLFCCTHCTLGPTQDLGGVSQLTGAALEPMSCWVWTPLHPRHGPRSPRWGTRGGRGIKGLTSRVTGT